MAMWNTNRQNRFYGKRRGSKVGPITQFSVMYVSTYYRHTVRHTSMPYGVRKKEGERTDHLRNTTYCVQYIAWKNVGHYAIALGNSFITGTFAQNACMYLTIL